MFAATFSDGETAADKCEELDEGYLPCSEFLYSSQVDSRYYLTSNDCL